MDEYYGDSGLLGLVGPVHSGEDPVRYSATGNLLPDAAWKRYQYDGLGWVKTGAEWTIENVTVNTVERRGPHRAKLVVTGLSALPTLDSDFIDVGPSQVYAYALAQALTRTAGRFLVQLLEYDSAKALIQTQTLLAQDGGSAAIEEFDTVAGWSAGTATALSSDAGIKQHGTNSMKMAVTALGAGASSVNSETSATQDITGFDPTARIRWSVRAGTRANLNYVALRWGSDAANYYEWRATNPGDLSADDTWFRQADVLSAPDATVGTPDTAAMDYLAVVIVAAGGGAYTGNVWVDLATIDPVGGDAAWPSVLMARFMGATCIPPGGVAIDVTLHANTRFVKLRNASDQLASGTWYVVSQTINDGLLASLDANPLSMGSRVYADAGILYIDNGAVIFRDQFGQTALNGYGFGPTWVQFVNDRIFNSSFVAGSTSDIPVSEVGGGDTDAEYLASLSPNLPGWVVAQSDATLAVVTDAAATHSTALKSSWTSGTQFNRIYQDVPVSPGVSYVPVVRLRWDITGTPFTNLLATCSWRKGDHSIIGAETVTALGAPDATGDQLTYLDHVAYGVTGAAPSDAVYLRVELHQEMTGAIDVWLDSVRLYAASGGWGAQAFGAGVNNATNFGSTTNLAIVAAGVGGAVAQLIDVGGPMLFRQYFIWSSDTTLLRTAEVRLYRDVQYQPNLVEVPGSAATFSFTPVAASSRGAAVTHPEGVVFLEPGTYWAVLRNTSTLRTFGLGFLGNGAQVLMNNASSRTNAAALGATLDIVTGWSVTGAVFALGLRGSIQGRALDW
jgi:hypothetical protein